MEQLTLKIEVVETGQRFELVADASKEYIDQVKPAIQTGKEDPEILKRFTDKIFFALTDLVRDGVHKILMMEEFKKRKAN